MKRCGRCKEGKEAGQFHRDASRASGLQCWCKACHKEYRNKPASLARRRLMDTASRYGLAADEVRRLRSLTHCQCCGQRLSEDPQLRHIDHCHETGMVRGMVCRQCNLIMHGPAAECIDRMRHCIVYLSEYPKPSL